MILATNWPKTAKSSWHRSFKLLVKNKVDKKHFPTLFIEKGLRNHDGVVASYHSNATGQKRTQFKWLVNLCTLGNQALYSENIVISSSNEHTF